MRTRKKVTILAVLGLLVASLAVAVTPVSACDYGCTPGFWKQPQHFGYWIGYSPGQTVGSVFATANTYFPALADDTLLEALDYGGGPDLEGGARNYLRAAVALLLSSAYNQALATPEDPDPWAFGWDWTPAWIVDKVNTNLSTENRAILITWAEQYDLYNNAELGCPLEGQSWE